MNYTPDTPLSQAPQARPAGECSPQYRVSAGRPDARMGQCDSSASPPAYDLTYSDVFMVPRRSAVSSRLDVDLSSTDGVGTTLPLVVANMTAISGRRMAETVARRGGIAILPAGHPDRCRRPAWSTRSRRSHPVYDTPVTVDPHTTVGETLSLLPKRAHGLAVVVQDGRPLGTVSEADAAGVDRFAQAHEVMSADLLTVDGRHVADRDLRQPDPPPPARGAGAGRRPAGRGDDAQARAALDPLPAGARRRGPADDRRGGGHQR